ncbi:MAG: hypothetical protein IKZ52_00705 [Bacteroidales bacterium]|nr:hypothetical protein [Bacteroidales bacterium]
MRKNWTKKTKKTITIVLSIVIALLYCGCFTIFHIKHFRPTKEYYKSESKYDDGSFYVESILDCFNWTDIAAIKMMVIMEDRFDVGSKLYGGVDLHDYWVRYCEKCKKQGVNARVDDVFESLYITPIVIDCIKWGESVYGKKIWSIISTN